MTQQSRFAPATPESEAFWLAVRILSVPRMETQALAVFPGLGDDLRVQYAIEKWEEKRHAHFLVAGCYHREKTARRFNLETLRKEEFALMREDNVHTQVEAAHTLDQCTWVADHLQALTLGSVSIVAPPFHLPRVFLTLLKQVNKRGRMRVVIIPDPVPQAPHYFSPETGAPAYEMVHAEFERIAPYQTKGDVATSKELDEYLGWLYTFHF